jgi:hypothetical protein
LLAAIGNDLASILGDRTVFINFPIFRRTVFDPANAENALPRHIKYGAMNKVEISLDNKGFAEITHVESAVIDCFIKMYQMAKSKQGDIILQLEKSKGNYATKFSTIMAKHLAIFSTEFDERHSKLSRNIILELMSKLRPTISVIVPRNRTKTTDKLFGRVFMKSPIWNSYKAVGFKSP